MKGVESLSKKKVLFSVTAGAAIASTFIGADDAQAASYKVKSGDSLWKIADSYNTTVADLKSINKLNGDLIFPNQVLQTSGKKDKPSSNSSKPSSSSKSVTYTVKSGDTLSGIASKHGVSFKDIMKWNDLSTTLIFPGNKLTVSESKSSGNKTETKPNNNSSSTSSTYVVKSGDTLSHIAKAEGVTVRNLKKWNNLQSDIIHIGQKLKLKAGSSSNKPSTGNKPADKPAEKPSNPNNGFDVNKLLEVGNSVMGTPYVWGGQTTSGFDCSGFIHFAYNEAGLSSGRTSTDGYFNRSHYIDQPQVGDLVFFKGTYRAGISHMGIYIGNNEFMHAGTSTGVTITSLDNPYWKQHFDSFKRFY